MPTRTNLTIYDEDKMVAAIHKFQKLEDDISYTLACTKLIKKALRADGLLERPKL